MSRAENDGLARLPHAAPARIVERVLERGERDGRAWARCEGRIDPRSPLLRAGHLPGAALVELVAQAAAALGDPSTDAGANDGRTVPNEVGLLLSVRTLDLAVDAVPADLRLLVEVEALGSTGDGTLRSVAGRVWAWRQASISVTVAADPLAEARVAVLLTSAPGASGSEQT